MAASLGSVSFITLKGHFGQPALQVEDISRPGVNGAAFRKVHTRGEPFRMVGYRDCDSLADAQSKFESLVAKQGTVVSVTDDYGVTESQVMVLGVERVAMPKLVLGSGGVSSSRAALLVVSFVLQIVSTT